MSWSRTDRKKGIEHVYTDVVIDFETLATDAHATVLSLGAVRFHPHTSDDAATIEDDDRCFYARFDDSQQADDGRSVDPATTKWWMEQSKKARAVFQEDTEEVTSCLERFVDFCKGAKRIWGNSNMFDNSILRDLCHQYRVPYPVNFRKDMDYRTLLYTWRKIMPFIRYNELPDIGDDVEYDHTALSDAKAEALSIQKMFKDIKER